MARAGALSSARIFLQTRNAYLAIRFAASNLIINIPAHTYIPLAIGFILAGVNLRKIPSRPTVIRQPHYFSRRRTICSMKFAGPMREREPNILRTVETGQSENARAINVALPGLWLSATIYTYCVSVR
jgi:hypothetical protein